MSHAKAITLADLQKRCVMLRKKNPKLPKCCSPNCQNPVDVTLMGEDTSCPYHRLLHDYFLYEVDQGASHPNNGEITVDAYRKLVNDWETTLGKEKCDAIVLDMAQDPLNWEC